MVKHFTKPAEPKEPKEPNVPQMPFDDALRKILSAPPAPKKATKKAESKKKPGK